MNSLNRLCIYSSLLLFLPLPCAGKAVIDEHGLRIASHYAKKKDYKSAYSRFKKMAEKGCPYSQCILGIMYQKGIGVEKDIAKSIYWFEQSAKQGYADAEHRLGMLHLNGAEITRNVEAGAQWLEKAAQHGVIEAKYELGKLDVTERSEKALEEGRAWIQEAASQGFSKAVELAARLPQVPSREAPPATRGMEQGLMNIQKSWTGYADLTKSLDDLSSSASK